MTLFEKLIPVPLRIQSDSGSVVERSDHQLPMNLFGAFSATFPVLCCDVISSNEIKLYRSSEGKFTIHPADTEAHKVIKKSFYELQRYKDKHINTLIIIIQ